MPSAAAQHSLVEENMKLVLFVARKYARLLNLDDFDDLVQEGNVGLIKAAETFDKSKGFSFSTWAVVHIKAAIFAALSDKARMIRIPRHIIEAVLKMTNELSSLEAGDSGKPDEQKITALVEITNQKLVSLNQPLYRDDDRTLFGDTLEDNRTISPHDASVQLQLKNKIQEMITARLSKRESKVIVLRFGLLDGIEHSLAEIGRAMEISVAGVRSIEATALRKLRHPDISNRVRGLSIFAPVHP